MNRLRDLAARSLDLLQLQGGGRGVLLQIADAVLRVAGIFNARFDHEAALKGAR